MSKSLWPGLELPGPSLLVKLVSDGPLTPGVWTLELQLRFLPVALSPRAPTCG